MEKMGAVVALGSDNGELEAGGWGRGAPGWEGRSICDVPRTLPVQGRRSASQRRPAGGWSD